jgi:hypothetical protein
MIEETTIHFSKQMRDRWPMPLATEWHEMYPDLFDDDDLRLALAQPKKHFYEWLSAVHLFHRDGALSLVEKYGYGNHGRKVERLVSVLGADGAAFVRAIRPSRQVQPPDLFVYVPGTPRFWFAEVKGPTDSLMTKQTESHVQLAERFGVAVEIIKVRRRSRTNAR